MQDETIIPLEALSFDPESLADVGLPDPDLLEYYNMLSRREIMLDDEIDDHTAVVSRLIRQWNLEDRDVPVEERKPIKIFLQTCGGDVLTTMNICDMIEISRTPVYTIAMGNCYSAGALIFISGHRRFAFRHTALLLHDGSAAVGGDTGKVLDNMRFTEWLTKVMNEHIIKHTKISKGQLEKRARYDWYLVEKDIMKYGLADKIIDSIDDIA